VPSGKSGALFYNFIKMEMQEAHRSFDGECLCRAANLLKGGISGNAYPIWSL
jgi:hypothetical protein